MSLSTTNLCEDVKNCVAKLLLGHYKKFILVPRVAFIFEYKVL